ncbi:MAG: C45 family autoproteolytic acyltransferase/hydolase [Terriglobia bacterium]
MEKPRQAAGMMLVASVIIIVLWLLVGPVASPFRSLGAPVAAADHPGPSPEGAKALLGGAYRFERDGWIFLHLEGSPRQIGYQHGYLLAPEILDAFEAVKLRDTHDTQRDWGFFRQASREMLWPRIDSEYQEELQGISEGLKAQKAPLDLDDVVALNAFEELADYYVPWYNAQHKVANAPHLVSPGNCSAFVATGGYTRDHRIVIAHTAWSFYLWGERFRVIYDIHPQRGQSLVMVGFPGVITSDDDFGFNSGGLLVMETTITQFAVWDPHGKPEFMRSRKALQYAHSIDDYERIMLDGNNGGYANDWLLADNNTGEIAQFELGLKAHRTWRTKDGVFVGSNFPLDPEVIAKDTTFDPHNPATSPNARRTCWAGLLAQNKGKIDVTLAEQFLANHYDAFEKRDDPDERTLCGHVDSSPRGADVFGWPPYYPGGAVQGKAMDSSMAKAMSFYAHMGHPCGEGFHAASFLKAHPEYNWQAPLLRDMKAWSWTRFQANEHKP